MAQKDYYQILGVAKGATPDDIKKAYRRLAHQHHPDKTGGDDARFKEINEAYYVLSDPKRRESYDRFGSGPGAAGGAGAGFRAGFTEGFDGWFQDILEQFFGGGLDETFAQGQSHGRDLAVELTMELEQVRAGLQQDIPIGRYVKCKRCVGVGGEPGSTLQTCATCSGAGKLHRVEQTFFGTMTRLVICPDCQGVGEVPEDKCTTCKGSGRNREQSQVSVTIPAGVEDGETFAMRGAGDVPEHPAHGGRTGTLYVTVRIAAHPKFRREADDLWTEEEISFLLLVRGGTATLQDLEGKDIKLKIPKGTPSGKVFRITGKGLPSRRKGASTGALFVTVHAHVPEKPSKELIDGLRELGDELAA
jgi:molecular chaperone DnaJ